jgi:hypothetical protein
MSSSPPPVHPRLHVRFGQNETRLQRDGSAVILSLAIPHLAGPTGEDILSGGGRVTEPAEDFVLLESGDWLAGAALGHSDNPLDQVSHRMYRDLLGATEGWSICRIWNYVPRINRETTGLENYRRFNLGRWQAYRDFFGSRLHEHLAAGSAVGVAGQMLAVVFLATRGKVVAVENPEQVPAWRYPEIHGPKSPSFARAALAGVNGSRRGWVSGTASIKGHESVAPGEPMRQLDITLDNLRLVLGRMGFPPLGATSGRMRHHLKVYLRDAANLEAARCRLDREGLNAGGPEPIFLQADICRRELEVEIEVSCREAESGRLAAVE